MDILVEQITIKNFFYQAKSQINSINTTFNAGINKKDFGAFSFYSTKYPNQFEKLKQLLHH